MQKTKQNIRITFLITLILTAVCHFTTAQNNYEKGYYITWDNDTVHGMIDNKGGSGNSLSCTFKKDNDSKSEKFGAADIQAYRFASGQYYISKKIDIKGEVIQAFVEFLVDGISNLYFYRDPENYFYLVENEKGEVLELYKEEVAIEGDKGKPDISHDTYRHIRMLKLAFSDCMEIQPQVEHAELTHRSLMKLTRKYHNYMCEDGQECIVYEKDLGRIGIYVAPVIGVRTSTINFDNGFYSLFNYDRNLKLSFGLQTDFVLTRIDERVSLQLDFFYNNNDIYGTYNDYYELFINHDLFQTSLLLKYSFLAKKVRPTIAIGFHANVVMNQNVKALVDNIPESPPQERDLENIYMASSLFGGIAQIGLNYRIFKNRELFTNLRYTYSVGGKDGFGEWVNTTIKGLDFSIGMYINKVR